MPNQSLEPTRVGKPPLVRGPGPGRGKIAAVSFSGRTVTNSSSAAAVIDPRRAAASKARREVKGRRWRASPPAASG